jgi:hypothetical protein
MQDLATIFFNLNFFQALSVCRVNQGDVSDGLFRFLSHAFFYIKNRTVHLSQGIFHTKNSTIRLSHGIIHVKPPISSTYRGRF